MAGQTERLLARARDRFTVQDYYGAIYLLEEIVASGRAFADVHHLIGVSLSLLGRSEEALTQFRQRARAQPALPRGAHPPGPGAERAGPGRRSRGGVPPCRGERGAADGRLAGAGGRAARQPARRAGRRLRRGGRAGPGDRAVRARPRARPGLPGPALPDGAGDARGRPAARGARGAGGRCSAHGPTSSTRRPRSASPISSPATASGRATSGAPASRAGPRMRGSRPTWRCWDAPARESRLGRARRRGVAAGRRPGAARAPAPIASARATGPTPTDATRTRSPDTARSWPDGPTRGALGQGRCRGARTRTSCARRRRPTCGWPAATRPGRTRRPRGSRRWRARRSGPATATCSAKWSPGSRRWRRSAPPGATRSSWRSNPIRTPPSW